MYGFPPRVTASSEWDDQRVNTAPAMPMNSNAHVTRVCGCLSATTLEFLHP
jgi:hypothetical protein